MADALDAHGDLDKCLDDSGHKRGKEWEDCADAPVVVSGLEEVLCGEDVGEDIGGTEQTLEDEEPGDQQDVLPNR